MFLKFASADVIEYRWAKDKVSSYDGYRKLSDFSFNDYLTADGYIYARVRAIASKTNKNWDSWPAEELQKAYRTFVGKPIFVDHHNHSPSKARGVVVDAELHIDDSKTSALDPYFSSQDVDPLHLPPTWIELLLEVDAKRFPKLARAIVSGEIDSVSMGADVGYTTCNICSNRAEDPSQFCRHIMSKGAYFDYRLPDGTKTSRRAAEHCFKVAFFEISWVFEPAEETALALDIKTANMRPDYKHISNTASMFDITAGLDDYGDAGGGLPSEEEALAQMGEDETGLMNRNGEQDRIHRWRLQQLTKMGYPPELAEQIAAQEYRGTDDQGVSRGVDIHQLEDLIGKGASPEQAHGIVAKRKLAENPIPQADMTKMPQSVDTLRQEDVCNVCGSTMADGECSLCGYTTPPEGFDNPDLQKAKEVDKQLHDNNPAIDNPGESMDQTNQISGESSPAASTSAPVQMSAKYVLATTNPDGSLSVRGRTSAVTKQPVQRINTQERPLLPPGRQNSDLPLAVRTIQNPTRPLESNLRLRTKENMPNTKTADGASPWGEGTQAEKRVELLDVGGVSGDPLSGIESTNVEKDTGDFTAPHTKTWGPGDGDSLGQHDPVTSEAFEGGGQGSGNAASGGGAAPYTSRERHADTSADLGGPIAEGVKSPSAEHGNSAGGQSAPGFPDSQPARIDLNSPLREEVGDRTMTFGQDDFHITNPVTRGDEYDANNLGGPIGEKASSFTFAMKAVKLAEAEAALGWVQNKWNRVAELEHKSEEYVDAQLEAISKARTASVRNSASARKIAGRMPSFRNANVDPVAMHTSSVDTEDSLAW